MSLKKSNVAFVIAMVCFALFGTWYACTYQGTEEGRVINQYWENQVLVERFEPVRYEDETWCPDNAYDVRSHMRRIGNSWQRVYSYTINEWVAIEGFHTNGGRDVVRTFSEEGMALPTVTPNILGHMKRVGLKSTFFTVVQTENGFETVESSESYWLRVKAGERVLLNVNFFGTRTFSRDNFPQALEVE